MHLQSLNHLIEVVRAVARPHRICLLGSSSLLAQFPDLGENGKLMVSRVKDLDLVRAILRLGIVEPERLRGHYQQSPLGERESITAGRNLTLLLRELNAA